MKELKGIAETKNSIIVDKEDFSEKVVVDLKDYKTAYENFSKNIPRKTGLYFFYDNKNNCVYVGISGKDIKERIFRHMFAKIGTPSGKFKNDAVYKHTGVSRHRNEISYVRYMLVDTAARAKMLETYFINVLTPKFNKQENWGNLTDELAEFNPDEE